MMCANDRVHYGSMAIFLFQTYQFAVLVIWIAHILKTVGPDAAHCNVCNCQIRHFNKESAIWFRKIWSTIWNGKYDDN